MFNHNLSDMRFALRGAAFNVFDLVPGNLELISRLYFLKL